MTTRAPAGFTLIEAVLSMLVVAIAAVATLQILPAVIAEQRRAGEQTQATLLFTEIVAELNAADFHERRDSDAALGRDTGETTRARFDDIDDYHNWTEAPPQSRDGTPRTDLAGWDRSIAVSFFDPINLAPTDTPTRAKIIDITIRRDNRVILQHSVVVTQAWRNAIDDGRMLLTVSGSDAFDLDRRTYR